MMVVVLTITTSTITGTLASYIIQQVNAQNKTGNFVAVVTNSVKKNPSSGAASPNWSGPVSFSSTLSRTMTSKLHTFLSMLLQLQKKQ
jgi:hypothetical protein